MVSTENIWILTSGLKKIYYTIFNFFLISKMLTKSQTLSEAVPPYSSFQSLWFQPPTIYCTLIMTDVQYSDQGL